MSGKADVLSGEGVLMRVGRWWLVLLGVALLCARAGLAQAPDDPKKDKAADKPKAAEKPKMPDKGKSPELPPAAPPGDPFAQAPARGGEAPSRGFNPHMLGDFQGLFARQLVTLPTVQTINTFQPVTTTQFRTFTFVGINGVLNRVTVPVPVTNAVPVTFHVPGSVTVPAAVPILGLGGFKIGENEGVAPDDRAYVTYNTYRHVRGPDLGPGTDVQNVTINGLPATVTSAVPRVSPVNTTREVVGFEQSFLDGMVSGGLRLPLVDQQGDGTFAQMGDLTGIVKVALLRDPGGSVVSAGLGVTAPTGPSVLTTAGDVHSTLFQPFLGYRFVGGDFFVQGFTSVAVPTNDLFPTILFNDVGVGYTVYRGLEGAAITQVSPVLEAHLTTPLTRRGPDSPVPVPDLLVLVAGVQVGIYGPTSLTFGLAAPVTGPRVFDLEAIVQLNLRF